MLDNFFDADNVPLLQVPLELASLFIRVHLAVEVKFFEFLDKIENIG